MSREERIKEIEEAILGIEYTAKLELGHNQEKTPAQLNAYVRGKRRSQIVMARHTLPFFKEQQEIIKEQKEDIEKFKAYQKSLVHICTKQQKELGLPVLEQLNKGEK